MFIQRIYEKRIINEMFLDNIAWLLTLDPTIDQAQDVAIENRGLVELKFSLN